MVNQRPPRRDLMSSLEVFIKHYEMKGAIGILDVECYEEWVATRRQPAQYPEESFRRSIIAHIRKASGRKAFPPQIESELLKVMRKKEPWPMAKALNIQIGSQGFRCQGYHEAEEIKRREGNVAGNTLINVPLGVEEPRLHKYTYLQNHVEALPHLQVHNETIALQSVAPNQFYSNQQIYVQSDCTNSQIDGNKDALLFRTHAIPGNLSHPISDGEAAEICDKLRRSLKTKRPYDEVCRIRTPSKTRVTCNSVSGATRVVPVRTMGFVQPCLPMPKLKAWLEESSLLADILHQTGLDLSDVNTPTSEIAEFVRTIMTLFSPVQFAAFCKAAGANPFSAVGLYMLENVLEHQFLLETTQRKFLCPIEQDAMSFEPLPSRSSNLGKFRWNLVTTEFLASDKEYRAIAGGDPKGFRTLDIQPSKLHMLLTMRWGSPIIARKGSVWTHMRFQNMTTRRWMVLRAHWQHVGENIFDVTIQDVSNLYPPTILQERPSLY
mmetsp:Transcript_5780/g.10351  ORF Transcript_5780/g.10351 Transcript_5780/m.10351 type:complete len:493 (-) Transcript_5780:925-2403(-)